MNQRIVILGAGPAGLTLAMKLLSDPELGAEVVVIEQMPYVGGIAASFEYQGLFFDYGSHRLHPSTSPEILRDIRRLLGEDLLDRPRNGRIRLLGRFVKFPFNPLELVLRLPTSFSFGVAWDAVSKPFKRKHRPHASFADVLLDGLGKTICDNFYFPYAKKLWGLDAEEIAPVQAQRRVSANSVGKMIRKALGIIPGLKEGGGRRFFYPRKGFGQLCHAMAGEIERLGGEIRLSTVVKEIFLKNNCPARILARSQESTAGDDEIPVDFLFSTIPITGLVNCVRPKPPPEVIATSERMRYRSMVLSYLVLATDRFSPYDAHYFPGTDTVFSRLSEPKNYSDTKEPLGLTGLCVEIPCWAGDEIWNASERAVFSLTMKNMARAGMPVRYPVRAIFVRRIRHAYPAYDLDYEARVGIIEEYLSGVPHLISLGRQGLFAHDNTHHSMEMAYRAGECLEQGLVWNSERWKFYREEFDRHVVED